MISDPDIIILVRFKPTSEGGRSADLSGQFYACPLFIDGEGFDCRIFLGNQDIKLGEWHRLPVKFLNRSFVMPMLIPGKPITLWEGKDIAYGEVLQVLPNS